MSLCWPSVGDQSKKHIKSTLNFTYLNYSTSNMIATINNNLSIPKYTKLVLKTMNFDQKVERPSKGG